MRKLDISYGINVAYPLYGWFIFNTNIEIIIMNNDRFGFRIYVWRVISIWKENSHICALPIFKRDKEENKWMEVEFFSLLILSSSFVIIVIFPCGDNFTNLRRVQLDYCSIIIFSFYFLAFLMNFLWSCFFLGIFTLAAIRVSSFHFIQWTLV